VKVNEFVTGFKTPLIKYYILQKIKWTMDPFGPQCAIEICIFYL